MALNQPKIQLTTANMTALEGSPSGAPIPAWAFSFLDEETIVEKLDTDHSSGAFFRDLSVHHEHRNGTPLIQELLRIGVLKGDSFSWSMVNGGLLNHCNSVENFFTEFESNNCSYAIISAYQSPDLVDSAMNGVASVFDDQLHMTEYVTGKSWKLDSTTAGIPYIGTFRVRSFLTVFCVKKPTPPPSRCLTQRFANIVELVHATDVDGLNFEERLRQRFPGAPNVREAFAEWKGVSDPAVFLLDIADDPSFPTRCSLEDLAYKKHLLDRDGLILSWAATLLTADSYECDMWNTYFHTVLRDHRTRSTGTKAAQKAAGQSRSWSATYGAVTNTTCLMCGVENIDKSNYPSTAIHQGHIAPAMWGAMDDKHWWNIVPICRKCNLGQWKGGTAEDYEPRSHMFIFLKDGYEPFMLAKHGQAVHANAGMQIVRQICLAMLKEVLGLPCKTEVAHFSFCKWTLLAFAFGFYMLLQDAHVEAFEDPRWEVLFLTPAEINELETLAAAP